MTGIASAWPQSGSSAGRRWSRTLALGMLWGTAASAMEAVSLPADDEGVWQVVRLMLEITPGWSVVGVGVAALAELAGARIERPLALVAIVVASSVALGGLFSSVHSLLAARGLGSGTAALFPNGVDPSSAFAYQIWIVLFYGGFYVVAWRLNDRAERTREVLGQAEIARFRAETLLGQAQLASLHGRVEPGLLHRAVTEVERRYTVAVTAAAADRLLNLLVAFLRLAMPAVRSGSSTLAAELALARAYTALFADLEPGRTRWTIVGEAPPDVPFPALLLLPLLDACAAAAKSPYAGHVCVDDEDGVVTLRLRDVPAHGSTWLPDELGYRTRVALSALYGDAWAMSEHDPDDPPDVAFTLILRPCPAPIGVPPRGGAALQSQLSGGIEP